MKNLLRTTLTLPNNELRAILNHVVGRYVRLEDCTAEQRAHIDDLVKQRLTGMPLAKIIGRKEFWKHHFITTQDTLDPRPDSETLIEAVLKTCPVKPYRILDLGTGTGCLLISLLEEYPKATGVGVDISGKALEVARRNAAVFPGVTDSSTACIESVSTGIQEKKLDPDFRQDDNIGDKATWIQSNWCENLSGAFDIIVCNPPYIDPSEPINEGATFDPPLALYGGIHTYEAILQSIGQHLAGRPQHLFFEIGYTQAADVSALLKRCGYHNIQIFKDLSGHDRVVSGRA